MDKHFSEKLIFFFSKYKICLLHLCLGILKRTSKTSFEIYSVLDQPINQRSFGKSRSRRIYATSAKIISL